MNLRTGRTIPNPGRSRLLSHIPLVGIATMFLVLIAPPGTTRADGQQYAVVARLNAKGAGLAANEVALRIDDIGVPATAIRAHPDLPRNIAIVMDTGPDQKDVLSREEELAVAVINEFFDGSTPFCY